MKYVNKQVTFTAQNGQRYPGYLGYYEEQPQPVRLSELKHNSHPLLIGGIIAGALFGIIACLPAAARGWVVLAVIAGIAWFVWRASTDPVPQQVGVRDYAPRAELVKLPQK